MNLSDTWLIGAGRMAVFYAAAFNELGHSFSVVGRGRTSAINFQDQTGLPVFVGGLRLTIDQHGPPQIAVVATAVEHLASCAKELLSAGTKYILLEKPGGLHTSEIKAIHLLASKHKARVMIGYNRRFFASTIKAKELIQRDGGIDHLFFDFSEKGELIETRTKGPGVRENWLLANSSHVIDLAFFLAGPPKNIHVSQNKPIKWHPTGSVFSGSGDCSTGTLFSYRAAWMSPGNWSLEIITPKRRLLMQPLETLKSIQNGEIVSIDIDASLDKNCKPGVYRQLLAFLNRDNESLCTIEEQVSLSNTYKKIANYS